MRKEETVEGQRTILFLERVNPERYKVAAEVTEIDEWTLRPPKTHIGITITGLELERCQELGIPALRRCLSTDQAFPAKKPEAGCQFIALLQLKPNIDRSLLHNCTLEEALDLCETFDGR